METACRYSRSTHQSTARQRPWVFGRPPRPPPIRRSVARWEKDFYESLGVPWPKVTGPDVFINANLLNPKVLRWDDSGAVEALLAAKRRYWAQINGGIKLHGVAAVLPDPDMYIDVVAEDGGVDPELDAEFEAARRAMEDALEENVNPQAATLHDDFVPVPTGWDVDW